VTWIDCGGGGRPPAAACAGPLHWNELMVRIVANGPNRAGVESATLGFADVDLATGKGSLATVYADRVTAMALAACINSAELLGRAMAHEVGHLLLGTNRHAARGLMRANWPAATLRRGQPDQWLFAGGEGDQMRKGVASRLPPIS
jgi:hypothetical protein